MWTYTLPSERSVEILNEAGYPLFTNADSCARTMRAMADYRALRERLLRPAQAARVEGRPRGRARAAGGVGSGAVRMAGAASAGGLRHCRRRAGDARAFGRRGGSSGARSSATPVALKVQSADIPHKTEAGAWRSIFPATARAPPIERVLRRAKRHAPHARIDGVLVQPMAPPGREVILGVNRDPTWGPLLMVGLGGVLVEALGDVALAPVPLDHAAARALLGRLKGAKVLGHYRGAPAADIDALIELIVRLSHFAADSPTRSPRSTSIRSSCTPRDKAFRSSTP